MDNRILGIILGTLIGASHHSSAQDNVEFAWLAYPQLTAEKFDGSGGISFGTDRLRTRFDVGTEQLWGRLQLDFGATDLSDNQPGALANVIADVFVNYRLSAKHELRFGQFKTPLGMDLNRAAYDLDLTKRGMEVGLTLGRDIGLMIGGRRLAAGFGYDIGIFNPAGRSAATQPIEAQLGEDNVVVARGHYDTERWHVELSAGENPNAGGPNTSAYRVKDFGVSYESGPWTARLEWIEGDGIRGNAGRSEQVYYLHAAYQLWPKLELAARHYVGESDVAGTDTDLTNTYIGITSALHQSEHLDVRLQANYVIASGDELIYTGLRGFTDDGLLIQLQLLARK